MAAEIDFRPSQGDLEAVYADLVHAVKQPNPYFAKNLRSVPPSVKTEHSVTIGQMAAQEVLDDPMATEIVATLYEPNDPQPNDEWTLSVESLISHAAQQNWSLHRETRRGRPDRFSLFKTPLTTSGVPAAATETARGTELDGALQGSVLAFDEALVTTEDVVMLRKLAGVLIRG